jgi:hypothetical protein
MKPGRKRLLVIVASVLLGLVALLVISGRMLSRDYPTTQTVEREFVLDDDFTLVRKILVRTDASKRIVTMTGDSEFIDQEWQAFGGGLDSIAIFDPQWRLQLHGTLRVRTQDAYIGQHEIALSQQVQIDPDQLRSDVELREPSERLLQYEMMTWFLRDPQSGKTIVRQRLTQEILTEAPWFAHAIADRRVRASIERALENQERAIRQIVDENRDRRWVFPFR